MSNRALTWAFEQSTGNAGRKAVLVALADKADEHNSCWPSQATLARMTDQSERTVRAHLADLEVGGLVTRKRRDAGGRRQSDRYILPVSVAVKVVNRATEPAKSAGSQPARSAERQPAKSVKSTGESRQETLREPNKASTTCSTRGTRLPDDWLRTDADKAWQAEKAIPDEFAREHTAEFRDYWKAKAGAGAVKVDWSATWRNWMRRAWRDRPGELYRRAHGAPTPIRDFDAEREAAKAQRARERFASTDGLASAR